jgi:hypothetical protein
MFVAFSLGVPPLAHALVACMAPACLLPNLPAAADRVRPGGLHGRSDAQSSTARMHAEVQTRHHRPITSQSRCTRPVSQACSHGVFRFCMFPMLRFAELLYLLTAAALPDGLGWHTAQWCSSRQWWGWWALASRYTATSLRNNEAGARRTCGVRCTTGCGVIRP